MFCSSGEQKTTTPQSNIVIFPGEEANFVSRLQLFPRVSIYVALLHPPSCTLAQLLSQTLDFAQKSVRLAEKKPCHSRLQVRNPIYLTSRGIFPSAKNAKDFEEKDTNVGVRIQELSASLINYYPRKNRGKYAAKGRNNLFIPYAFSSDVKQRASQTSCAESLPGPKSQRPAVTVNDQSFYP